MKLRIIGSRNASAVYRYPQGPIPQDIDSEDRTEPLEQPSNQEDAPTGIPDDMTNRLPSGGRSGNMKVDKFQGYKIPPMY